MTLHDELLERIATAGTLSLAEFMAAALLHPTKGYYTTQDPLGAKGDFTTAPEISQMFGEMLGLCLAQCWLDQGAPSKFTLAELGPGRGTLMADVLRATKGVPGFHNAAQVHLVEVSPTLRAKQSEALTGVAITHHDDITSLPNDPLFLLANEFFDALPIRQFQRTDNGWSERLVGANNGRLQMGLGTDHDQPALAHRIDDTRPGDIVEHCAAATVIAEEIGQRIVKAGGVALLIDYGDWRSLGDTLQALKDHQFADPFDAPGSADLTAHVDFETLALATPSAYTRLAPQGVFLERLGITQRAQALAKDLSGASLNAHIAAHRRLTHPDEMGSLFKVLGFFPENASPPPGLEK